MWFQGSDVAPRKITIQPTAFPEEPNDTPTGGPAPRHKPVGGCSLYTFPIKVVLTTIWSCPHSFILEAQRLGSGGHGCVGERVHGLTGAVSGLLGVTGLVRLCPWPTHPSSRQAPPVD